MLEDVWRGVPGEQTFLVDLLVARDVGMTLVWLCAEDTSNGGSPDRHRQPENFQYSTKGFKSLGNNFSLIVRVAWERWPQRRRPLTVSAPTLPTSFLVLLCGRLLFQMDL